MQAEAEILRELRELRKEVQALASKTAPVQRAVMSIEEVAAEVGRKPATVHDWLQNPTHWLHCCRVVGMSRGFERFKVLEHLGQQRAARF
jgi:predicted transcriptional regulator